jgi:hypothetical protein
VLEYGSILVCGESKGVPRRRREIGLLAHQGG